MRENRRAGGYENSGGIVFLVGGVVSGRIMVGGCDVSFIVTPRTFRLDRCPTSDSLSI